MDAGDLRGKALEATSKVRWIPPGARSGCGTCSPTGPTGASRASARGACRSRRRLHRLQRGNPDDGRWWSGPRRSSTSMAPTRGTSGRSRSSCLPECRALRAAARSFEREKDILDVWFDSGIEPRGRAGTERSCVGQPTVPRGNDQYRGWFQSSMLVGLGTRGEAPYRQVVTHGFVVDEKAARCRSRSATTSSRRRSSSEERRRDPALWVVMVDYREEVRIGPEILARVVEAYRKIRNTCRILVANLFDFDPAADAMASDVDLQEVDRYALARYAETARIADVEGVRRLRLPGNLPSINALMAVDLSAFYVDVSKDRLYTFARELAGTPLGADRDVLDGRRPGEADGADSSGHRRTSCGSTCRGSGRSRATRPRWRTLSPTPSSCRRSVARRA
jgi:hypothetical protein